MDYTNNDRAGRRGLICFIVVAVMLMAMSTIQAQDAVSTADERVLIGVDALPERVLLTGFDMIWQDPNRCSAAALSIQMSYFRDNISYYDTIDRLNPHEQDVSVRLDEMIVLAEQQGLRGIERNGGTFEMIKVLIANGFPVLIENVYYDGGDVMRDWMSHNRVIMGYDDTLGIFYAYDPLRGNGEGPGLTFEYGFIEERWRPMLRNYMILYEPGDEAFLQAVMGEQWDVATNAEWTLQQVQADLARPATDSFDNFNLGTALVALGRYDEAATAFDGARAIGLPFRMLWYQFGPFEAYLQVGRYADVYALTRSVIGDAPGVEEMYYYIARAYQGEGNTERAIANLEAALWRNVNYRAAAALLAELAG
jgi:tetratricopeptide (TPR) repeat protein